jgi:hypothetical protein
VTATSRIVPEAGVYQNILFTGKKVLHNPQAGDFECRFSTFMMKTGRKPESLLPLHSPENVSRHKNSLKPKAAFDPSEYRGLYRNLTVNLKRELMSLRQEWERM